MSSGLLPPIPDLIPIAALRKSSPCNNNIGGERARRDCAPCINRSEVMGEQRSRRTGKQPAVDLIDSSGSRGSSAAPQAPQSRKARSERHRKSDRRREHRKPARTRSDSKHSSRSRETSTPNSSPERPANPRVNPIFVWVRQEDTRIVDVKCEDYDKRNRILLTKTAQGWRAIPRTETLVPSLKEAADKDQQHHHHHHHHHHHRSRKSRKSKVRRKSTAVQVDSDIQDTQPDKEDEEQHDCPPWMSPINDVESLLPSHTIISNISPSAEEPSDSDISNVNSAVIESAQTQSIKCSADKISDVSPLDNLLAVAELEFNQQIQSGEWNKTSDSDILGNDTASEANDKQYNDIDDDDQKEFIKNMEQLNSFIESCSNSNDDKLELQNEFDSNEPKSEDCDYNEEEDDNNLAMDDILSRLEQSLRSPECTELAGNILNACNTNYESKTDDDKSMDCFPSDINENNYKPDDVPDEFENFFDQTDGKSEEEPKDDEDLTENKDLEKEPFGSVEPLVESSTVDEEPTDLSIKVNLDTVIIDTCDETEGPTDLSVPKYAKSPPRLSTSMSRPPSQNSEAIQSPQPSGIPAVPPSPDIVTTSANANNSKTKTVFLESLISNSSQKIALNSEVTIIRQKEPLDLGKCRKSASPTITCSQEINNTPTVDLEPPPTKKFKSNDITLKTLLDADVQKAEAESKTVEKNSLPETPRLLELLKTDSGPDPLTQLRQILTDTVLNVPDPMLVPKEKLSSIISHPAREIPKLLKQRPELRLPEALAFPHLLQDPDILVITLQQLETIILKQGQSQILKDIKHSAEKIHEKPMKRPEKTSSDTTKESPNTSGKKKSNETCTTKSSNSSQDPQGKCGGISELANDIDAATTAAFNQMMWLPYLNHLEAMSFGNNSEVIKMLTNSLPMYPNQIPDLSHIFGNNNRFPPQVGFPLQPPINYNNPLELSMWQEAMLQANMLRPKNPFENFNPKHPFRDYLDKITPPTKKSMTNNQMIPMPKNMPNHFYSQSTNNGHSSYQNAFLNVPNSYQTGNSKHLQVPQFNPAAMMCQKNMANHHNQHKSSSSSYVSKHQQKHDGKSNFPNFYSQLAEDKQSHMAAINNHRQEMANHRPKVVCKSFANVSHHQKTMLHEPKEKSLDFSKQQTSQPIDLSGSTTPGSKLKVKQHLIDPVNTPKLLKHDDVPEVGSTTASIEEMQDAHKHLWHPLFGNQKGYNSPWNWTTVTATGE